MHLRISAFLMSLSSPVSVPARRVGCHCGCQPRSSVTVVLQPCSRLEGFICGAINDGNAPDSLARGQRAWLAMPVATGLRAALGSPPSFERVVSAVAEIAETMAALHSEGISHRDLKPGNLLELDGVRVLGDFGLVD